MADITKITSGTLIAAEKVEGTDVYNLQGEKLGTVDDIMIDKVSGKAIYALMSFGGFLGIGETWTRTSAGRRITAARSTSTTTRRPTGKLSATAPRLARVGR